MTKICRAEAILAPEREVTPEILASARLTGILAAKKAWEIIPLAGSIRPLKTEIAIEVSETGTRIIASVEADGGGEASALLAATAAALCFNDMARGTLESVRPIDQI
ncbi:MAG: cyclic pyranopterin monophosphate synthase MoaC, partial [Rhizomicrobium sp.]